MSASKKFLGAAALAVMAVGATAGSAAADSGPRQDDVAPHSKGPVSSVINGDTNVSDVVEVNAPVNVPAIGSQTGPEQVGNEHSSEQGQFNALGNDLYKTVTAYGLPL